MSEGISRVGDAGKELAVVRFLNATGKALSDARREAMREWDRMGKVDQETDRAMVGVVEGLESALRDVARAAGIVKSQMSSRDLAFISSEEGL